MLFTRNQLHTLYILGRSLGTCWWWFNYHVDHVLQE